MSMFSLVHYKFLPLSNQDIQLKRMGLATLPRILCAFDVFDTHDDDSRLPIHVLIRGLHKGNKTFFELDLELEKSENSISKTFISFSLLPSFF